MRAGEVAGQSPCQGHAACPGSVLPRIPLCTDEGHHYTPLLPPPLVCCLPVETSLGIQFRAHREWLCSLRFHWWHVFGRLSWFSQPRNKHTTHLLPWKAFIWSCLEISQKCLEMFQKLEKKYLLNKEAVLFQAKFVSQ